VFTCLCARPPLFIPSARLKVLQDLWPANVLSDVDATSKLSKETMTLSQTEHFTSNRQLQQEQPQMPPLPSATTPQHRSRGCSPRRHRRCHRHRCRHQSVGNAIRRLVGERTTERENLRRQTGGLRWRGGKTFLERSFGCEMRAGAVLGVAELRLIK
jgi:hypothetical protein